MVIERGRHHAELLTGLPLPEPLQAASHCYVDLKALFPLDGAAEDTGWCPLWWAHAC